MRIKYGFKQELNGIKIWSRPRFDRLNSDRFLLPSLPCVRLCEARSLCVWRCSFCRFWCRFESSIRFLAGGLKNPTRMMISCAAFSHTVRQNRLVGSIGTSEIASLCHRNSVQKTPKYNSAIKPSVFSGLGAQKITLSWKIMATHSIITPIAHFHNQKYQNMATLNCISV